MSATDQALLSPLSASIDNVEDWEVVTQQITRSTGLPVGVTADAVLGLIRTAVPLMFEAQRAKNMNLLRGTFSAPVVAQCQRNAGCLLAGRPTSAVVHLVGGRADGGEAVLRAHVSIQGQAADGTQTLDRQFWDLRLGAQVTVAQPACPNCGAPIPGGELICGHCGTDVRSVVAVPMVVSRLDLY
jgi:hypothetical protein